MFKEHVHLMRLFSYSNDYLLQIRKQIEVKRKLSSSLLTVEISFFPLNTFHLQQATFHVQPNCYAS
ncbi:CLUMA_CG010265, isoform A [Clunio marinus]|uniref:CLUMA_CG010265, isoform A n=1 Tax=Clunio marinus TaxID=568069 RepID=A0A1J1IB45_9DIPT|nr:CLUMA_CG010265, isoform A [Clunio marinus]